MNVGTLSGLDVLTFGKIAPGAEVKLKDGSTGRVASVKNGWLSLGRSRATVTLTDGRTTKASSIAGVLREAPPSTPGSTDGDASAVSGSGVPRAAGV
jgi:hypothetical protein